MEEQLKHDIIPASCDMPPNVPCISQYIGPSKFEMMETETNKEENYQEIFVTDDYTFRSSKLKKRSSIFETRLYDKLNKAQLGPRMYRQYAVQKQLLQQSPTQSIKELERQLLNPSKSMPEFPPNYSKNIKIPVLSESVADFDFIGSSLGNLKSPSYYDSLMANMTQLRHETPPFVYSGNKVYDPLTQRYV